MRPYTTPPDRVAFCFGLLVAILLVVSLIGYYAQPAAGSPLCETAQAVVAPQVVLPAFPGYTQTPFYSNTLNMVGAQQRAEAVQQWSEQTEQRWTAAELRAMLALIERQQAEAPPTQPQEQLPATPPQIGSGIPPYAYAGEIPTIVARCGKCHTDGYSADGAAGGILLDGSDNLRAASSWQQREAIMQVLADKRMPPEGHQFSGELAGQIILELYAGRADAGGPANPE